MMKKDNIVIAMAVLGLVAIVSIIFLIYYLIGSFIYKIGAGVFYLLEKLIDKI